MTSKYAGPLFQLQRMSDNTTLDIYAGSNGMTDVSRINSFCAETSCNFSMLYDQISTNNLPQLVVSNQAALSFSTLPSQMQAPVVTMLPLQFYRNRDQTANIPKGDSALTEYMVVQGAPPALSPCCGTYGNMEATVVDDGAGTMFALALANARTGFRGTAGYGWGPWAGVDLEDGSYRYGPTVTADIVTVLAKYSTLAPSFVVKNGDASQDVLTTLYSGGLPAGYQANWEGGLSLGEGGDGSPAPISFYEGAIIAGASTDQADSAVQTSIASMYGPSSNTLVSGCQANNLVLFPLELIDLRTPGSGGVAAVSPWTPTKVALTQATDPSGKSTYATKITGNYGSQSASLAEKNVVPVLAGQRYVFTVYVLGTNDAGVFPGFSVQTNDAGNTQFAVALNTNSGKAVPGTWGNGKASSLQATKVDSNWWKVDTQFTAPAGSSLMNIFLGPPISDAHGMSSDHSPGLSTTYFCPSLSMVSSDK